LLFERIGDSLYSGGSAKQLTDTILIAKELVNFILWIHQGSIRVETFRIISRLILRFETSISKYHRAEPSIPLSV